VGFHHPYSFSDFISLIHITGKNTWFRGYETFGSQILEEGTTPDNKEGLFVGRDLSLDHPLVKAGRYGCGPNLWPESLGIDFVEKSVRYYDAMLALSQDVMEAIGLGLGLDDKWFEALNQDAMAVMRYIHYPPSTSKLEDERGTFPRSNGVNGRNILTRL
jgi:isopenicillin N synthase-like dioxygenase